MIPFNTPHDALQAIADLVKTTRLNQDITMGDLAARSGIGVATLARIEKRGICSTENLVKVLAVLGKVDSFITAMTPDEITSISELRSLSKKNPRKRAGKSI